MTTPAAAPPVPPVLADRIVRVDPMTLVLHPENPRRGDVEAIAESIRANGFVDPVVVQESTGYVVGGNHRVLAARLLCMPDVPVVYVDVDDTTARRLLVSLNRSAELADWDDEGLLALLDSIASAAETLDGTLYASEDVDALRASLVPPDPVPDPAPGGGMTPADVSCTIGPYSFTVDRETWNEWEGDVVARVGGRHEDVVAELRGSLGL